MDLIAVQPWMTLEDYASAHSFERKLDALVLRIERARREAGGGVDEALVVFPEMIGTFLMLAGESPGGARTVDDAIARTALRHAGLVARTMARHRLFSPTRAVLATFAPRARRLYVQAFARLARRLGAHVVAGSALLPDVQPDAPLEAPGRSARVFNTSYHFGPDGRIRHATRKINLVPALETGLGLTPGRLEDIAPVSVGRARVATLICYDGFSEPHTRDEPQWVNAAAHAVSRGAQVLAQPAANPWPWEDAWVHAEPGESLLRKEQWRCEGLVGQLPRLQGVRYAITSHLLAQLLDTRFEGRSEIVERAPDGSVRVLAEAARADAQSASETVLCVRVP